MAKDEPTLGVSTEQICYAAVMEVGTTIGFCLLLAAFSAYIAGIVPAHISLDRLPALWALPADEYAIRANVPRGWGWVTLLHRGEMLSQAAITTLAAVSIAAFAVVAAAYGKRRDYAYFALAVFEVIVLLLAASGVLTTVGY